MRNEYKKERYNRLSVLINIVLLLVNSIVPVYEMIDLNMISLLIIYLLANILALIVSVRSLSPIHKCSLEFSRYGTDLILLITGVYMATLMVFFGSAIISLFFIPSIIKGILLR